jgi:small-conductance mechanosensitive channel
MIERLAQLLATDPVWAKTARIVLAFSLALLLNRLAWRLARRVIRLGRFSPKNRQLRPERQSTLQGLVADAISAAAVITAILVSIGQFVQLDTVVWMVGLFSAAFGLGARPLISDVLTGIGLMFEDTFAVGEKVSILDVEGVVEAVNLRTTWIRASTGELYTVPNGEIRIVRNYSRGRFSVVSVKLKVTAHELGRALPLLSELGTEAVALLPNLLEPWQVLSESGVMGQQTELTLLAKARFGRAAEMRPHLLTLIQERLSDAGITLAD